MPVGRDKSLRKRDFELRAKFAGKIAFALNAHRLAGRRKNADAGFHQILRPRCSAQSMDCGMTTSLFFLISGTGLGKRRCEKVLPDERWREMAVIARQIRRDVRPGVRQRLPDAVRKRADAENHHRRC